MNREQWKAVADKLIEISKLTNEMGHMLADHYPLKVTSPTVFKLQKELRRCQHLLSEQAFRDLQHDGGEDPLNLFYGRGFIA